MPKASQHPDVEEKEMEQTLSDFFRQYREEEHPSQDLTARLLQTIPAPPQRWRLPSWRLALPSVAAMLAIVGLASTLSWQAWWPARGLSSAGQGLDPTMPTRRNGGASLLAKGKAPVLELLYARKAEGFQHKRRTHDGIHLRQGDLVQLSYRTKEALHMMVVSVNERGEVAQFVPFDKKLSQLVPSGRGALPTRTSLVLDGYVGAELFLLLASRRPFRFAQVQSAVRHMFRTRQKLGQMRTLPGPWLSRLLLIQKVR